MTEKEYQRLYQQEWRKRNQEKVRKYQKEYYRTHEARQEYLKLKAKEYSQK